jgi:hypothetical protein
MSKPLDPRTVEYAYVKVIGIIPNQPQGDGTTYKHIVQVAYELKDTNKNLLDERSMVHSTDSTGEDSVATYVAAVAAALPGFIAADKLELSGYAP